MSGSDDRPKGPPPSMLNEDSSAAVLAHQRERDRATASIAAPAGNVMPVVVPYEETLLGIATDLIVQGRFSIAVVVAHMACEIASERALSRAWAARGLTDLERPVKRFLNGYNLGYERIRDLYVALTGRRIQGEQFWQAFKESSERRNDIIHEGRIATKAEAEGSVTAATEVVGYLK